VESVAIFTHGDDLHFCIWASFYGEIPVLMIKDISVSINEIFFNINAIM
jgi:hypothetical protein